MNKNGHTDARRTPQRSKTVATIVNGVTAATANRDALADAAGEDYRIAHAECEMWKASSVKWDKKTRADILGRMRDAMERLVALSPGLQQLRAETHERLRLLRAEDAVRAAFVTAGWGMFAGVVNSATTDDLDRLE